MSKLHAEGYVCVPFLPRLFVFRDPLYRAVSSFARLGAPGCGLTRCALIARWGVTRGVYGRAPQYSNDPPGGLGLTSPYPDEVCFRAIEIVEFHFWAS